MFWFSQKSSYSRGGGDPDVSKGFFLCNRHICTDVFLLSKGNLACLTDNCLPGLVRTCLINCNDNGSLLS